ncbi:HNH endonuclease [Brevibacillus choshinensis]|uniref:HNH endonuclease n=1 Tax=Brevibacillus choshinensis TaxID=54911 RepID=UPI002E1A8381|nr:HNH endonuclease [Brevibacillus choshinensis]MED4582517.1 HNH endonuclease [Brevibacillus choshinensis]
MGILPEEAISTFRNSAWRYLAKVIGKYIETEVGEDSTWRNDSVWREIIAKDFQNECIYCGVEQGEEIEIKARGKVRKVKVKLEREHLNSISNGGLDIKANVAPACRTCNSIKGDRLDWISFFEELVKETEEQAEKDNIRERKMRVENYINNRCKWTEVQKHRLYNLSITQITTNLLENEVLQWITNWLNEDLYDYAFHITPKKVWDEAFDSEEKLYPLEANKIKCSYEHLLDMVVSDVITFKPCEELVLISFKMERLESKMVRFEVVYNGSRQPFIHIFDKVNINDWDVSKPFTLTNSKQSLTEALKSLPFSLTKLGRHFSGYELKISDK